MKKFLLFTAGLLGLALSSSAQDGPIFNSIDTRYKGYVITLSNDTIKGFILNSNKIDNQEEVLFYESITTLKKTSDRTFLPNDILAYKVGGRYYDSYPLGDEKDPKKKIFLLREHKGAITLYEFYKDPNDPNKSRMRRNATLPEEKRQYKIDESALQRTTYGLKDGVLTDLSESKYVMSYKKAMSEYLADYPELAKKIADKEKGYGFMNMLKHIYEYNDWAAKQPKK